MVGFGIKCDLSSKFHRKKCKLSES
jgi:hypothetical protein